MNIRDFPECCGAKILTRFGYDESCDCSLQTCEDFLQKQEIQWHGNISMLLVLLNEVEQAKLGKVFEKRGWTLVASDWSNPRTDHGLNLWLWKCTGEQPIKKKKSTQPCGQIPKITKTTGSSSISGSRKMPNHYGVGRAGINDKFRSLKQYGW